MNTENMSVQILKKPYSKPSMEAFGMEISAIMVISGAEVPEHPGAPERKDGPMF